VADVVAEAMLRVDMLWAGTLQVVDTLILVAVVGTLAVVAGVPDMVAVMVMAADTAATAITTTIDAVTIQEQLSLAA
jgi:hypothetical protein